MAEKLLPDGAFVWEELQSADLDKAIPFYRSLVDWETREWPLPGGAVYTLFGKTDEWQAGAQAHNSQETGSFTGWLSYVQVADVDAVCARVEGLGGRLLFAPHDIPEVGRCAVLQDPEGAILALMRFLRPSLEPEDPTGTFCWRELMSRDVASAARFYGTLLGWSFSPDPQEKPGEYIHIATDRGQHVGGMMAITPQMGGTPAMWTPYLAVADLDAKAAKATELGGTLCVPPTPIPNMGRFCIVSDPGGGTLGLYAMA